MAGTAEAAVVERTIEFSIFAAESHMATDYAVTAKESFKATTVRVNSALASVETSTSLAASTFSICSTILVVIAVVVVLCVIAYIGHKYGWWKRLGFY